MEITVIRELSTKELKERLDELKLEYAKLKMRHAISPVDNTARFREIRKDIARILTVLTERENNEKQANINKSK